MASPSQTTLELLLRVKEQGAEAIVRVQKATEQLAQKTAQAAQAQRQEAQAASQADSAHRKLAAGVQSVSAQLERAQRLFVAWQAGMAAFSGVRDIIDLADAWNQVQARLKLVTAGQQEYTVAQRETFAIAQRLGAGVSETATLYGKLQAAVRALGGTQQEALGLTESIGQALRISGASAGDSAAALLQFGQALASGVLRGDEFNSVMENAPRLAKALADGLGVSTGKLRQMAEAGQLTADVVVKALQSQSGALKAEFDQLPRTVGQGLTALSNAFMKWVGGINEATGATGKLATALGFVAEHMQAFAAVLTALAAGALLKITASLLPQMIAALRTAGLAAAATGVKIAMAFQAATLPIEFATAALGRFNVALSAIGAFVAGWQIGTMLREKFKPIEAIGDVIGASLGFADGAIRATYALISSIASGPQQAIAQFGVTLSSLGRAFGDMWEGAKLAFSGIDKAANTSGASIEELNARIRAVRLSLAESVGSGLQAVSDATAKLDTIIGNLDQDAAKAQGTVNAALQGIAQVRDAQTAAIDATLQEQTAAVQRQTEQQKALLEQQSVSQQARIQAESDLFVKQIDDQTKLREQATAKTLELIGQETQAKLSAAATDGKTLEERRAHALAAEEGILSGQRTIWQQAASAYQQHINALIGEENRHLQAVLQIEQARLGINASIEDKIRELRRQTMTDAQATEDRKTQIAQLQAQAREAIAKGEFDKAQEYANKSIALAETVGRNRGQEEGAISNIRAAQTLLNQALEGEAAAHKQAAAAAKDARGALEGQLATAKQQVEDLNKTIAGVQEIRLAVNTSAIPASLEAVQKIIAERETLLPIKADLEAAKQQLQQFDSDLKAGRSVQITGDITQGKKALEDLQAYAKTKANVDLQLTTAAAQGRLADLTGRIETLGKLEVAVKATVKDNVPQVKTEIDSLNGRNTSSTHTITVRQVEAHATGGLVGSVLRAAQATRSAVQRYAKGGMVFPRMAGGTVPGSGNGDTVPRLLDAGAFVLRKAAVQKYAPLIQKFADGGFVYGAGGYQWTGDLSWDGLRNMDEPSGLSEEEYRKLFDQARDTLERGWLGLKKQVAKMYQGFPTWFQPIGSLEQNISETPVYDAHRRVLSGGLGYNDTDGVEALNLIISFWKKWAGGVRSQIAGIKKMASGGQALAASDTVPALLTPGEFVVNRSAVQRLGLGFLNALNTLQAPPVRGYAEGGLVSDGPTPPAAPSAASSLTPAQITIQVNGVSDPERIARQIQPHLQRLLKIQAAA